MKNRAKCRLCGDILESFHRYDYVACKCGEISIDGGNDHLGCSAGDWKNFLRVDDEGNEVVVKTVDSEKTQESQKLSLSEQIDMLDTMVKNLENLPKNAMSLPINHYDLYSFVLLISSILSTWKKE